MNFTLPDPLFPREIMAKIVPFLDEETVIIIHGARQTGKTHLLYNLIRILQERTVPIDYFDLEDPELLTALNQGVDSFLQLLEGRGYKKDQKAYVFIDEIQYLDNPSSFLKLLVDHYKNLHLIVSGSSSFTIKTKFTDSLAGRTVDFLLHPLTFAEFLTFKQKMIDLNRAKGDYWTEKLRHLYREFLLFGGYPKIVLTLDQDAKKTFLNQIIDTYLRKDISDLGHVENPRKFNALLSVLASQTGQLLNTARLSRETGLSAATIEKYLFLLEETYILKLVSPFSRNPHVEISKNPKIFFYDSGLAGLLWLKNFPQTVFGNLLETNVFGELVKKYGGESIHFWRTKNKQEIDFVINGQPLEVKTNFGRIESGPMHAFKKKYHPQKANFVALDGEKTEIFYQYPWEI